ncbi:MAG: hypothetical protein KAW93_10105, partial [Methanogenium sp.]|nr:hypothetical protein [Methanogenium sp.]
DGSLIASGGDRVYLFERGGEVLWEHKTGRTVSAVSLSQNGSLLAACDERSLYLFHISEKSVDVGTVTETNTETITKTVTETEIYSNSQDSDSAENQKPVAQQSGNPSVAYISLLIMCMILVIQKAGQK